MFSVKPYKVATLWHFKYHWQEAFSPYINFFYLQTKWLLSLSLDPLGRFIYTLSSRPLFKSIISTSIWCNSIPKWSTKSIIILKESFWKLVKMFHDNHCFSSFYFFLFFFIVKPSSINMVLDHSILWEALLLVL